MSNAISNVSSSDLASAADASSRIPTKTLGQSDFLEIMIAQLQNQTLDNTTDTDKMMQNFMSMSNFQSMQDMNISMTKMYQQNQSMYAQSLVGRTVEVHDGDGNIVTGVVEGAYVTTSETSTNANASSSTTKVMITVNGTDYDAANIYTILQTPTQTETQS